MSYEFYKVLHILGLALVFAALGGQAFHVLNGGDKDSAAPARAWLGASHGVGLLIVLVAGFGMHAKLGLNGFPGWFLAKIALWLVLGAWIVVPWKLPGAVKALWVALPIVAGIGTWLAVVKPF